MYAARGHHGCGLMYYSIVPTFVKGAPDTKDLPGPPGESHLLYCYYGNNMLLLR